jgi:hypothetical protein
MPFFAFAHPPAGRLRAGFGAAALAGLLALAPVTGAKAQFARLFGWGMPAVEVYHIIAAQGLRVTAPVYRNGRVYVADVVDPRGMHERLIIDAYNGDILQAFLTGPVREPAPRERTVRAEPLEPGNPVEAPVSRSHKKPARSTARRESVPPANAAAPTGAAPAPAPVTAAPLPEPGTSDQPSTASAVARPQPAPETKAPEPKASAVTPVAPLDDAAGGKRSSQPATDVPVAPLE